MDGGFDVLTSESIEAATALLPGRNPFVLFVEAGELAAASTNGAKELLERATIIVLADPSVAATFEGASHDVFAVLERRDTAPGGLRFLVESARRTLHAAAAPVAHEPVSVVASSRVMKGLVRRMTSLADAATPFMLIGEEGVGRRTLARTCHARGRRAARPFVTLDFSEIDERDLEAALDEAAIEAATGTLHLHAIEALQPGAQAAVTRFLAAGSFPARLISTASPRLRQAVDAGELSKELYFRLAGRVVDVPPLRDRPDDVPVLAYTFAQRAADELGIAPKRFSAELLRALRKAPWPGNVPELASAIEAAVATGQREVLALGDLGFDRPLSGARASLISTPYVEARAQSLHAFERAYVEAVLEHAGGNQSRAAEIAGMDRANFRRLSKRALAEERLCEDPQGARRTKQK